MIITLFFILALLALRVGGAGWLMSNLAPPYGADFVVAIGVAMSVAVAMFLDRALRFYYWNGYLPRKRKQDTPALVKDIVTAALLALGISVGLFFEAGVSFTGLLAASGATAIVLGIALQAVIQDLFSGLSINFDGSYAIGDWLTIYSDQFPEPVYGRVAGITWRTTFLRLEDGRRVMIPNRLVTTNPVLNHSRPRSAKRFAVEIMVDVRFPSDRAVSILLGQAYRAVRQKGLTKTPDPDIIITKVTADAVAYEVRYYADPDEITPPRAHSLMMAALHEAILRHNLPAPVNQVELVPAPAPFVFDEKEEQAALARVPIFANILDSDQLVALAAACQVRALPAGTIFIRQGDEGASMFVIMEGAARVLVSSPGSENREVAVLTGGDIVGEMSLMTGAPRAATVTSITAMHVLEVTKSAIELLLNTAPGLLERFSTVLSARQLELSQVTGQALGRDALQKDVLARMRLFFSRVFQASGRKPN